MKAKFFVCVANDDCEDLEVRKIYQTIADDDAAQDGLLRIVDESGEDTCIPPVCFSTSNSHELSRKL